MVTISVPRGGPLGRPSGSGGGTRFGAGFGPGATGFVGLTVAFPGFGFAALAFAGFGFAAFAGFAFAALAAAGSAVVSARRNEPRRSPPMRLGRVEPRLPRTLFSPARLAGSFHRRT